MATLTGIFTKTLNISDFDTSGYDGVAITAGVPVFLYYQVLPGNGVAFGAGSNSYNGVRTAQNIQIKPVDESSTAVPSKVRLIYMDPNKVRQTVIKEVNSDYISGDPTTANQFNFLPETANMQVGAFCYLAIQITPNATSSGHTFSAENSVISVPATFRTYANASGE